MSMSESVDTQWLEELRLTYRDGLLESVLPFWMEHAIDAEYGGFTTALAQDGKIVDTDKSVWQQGRFTWLLARLYNSVTPQQEWLDAALHGAEFLEEHCFDEADGRMWFHVERCGRPIRKRRYSFSEAFASVAFGELHRATGEERFKLLAIATFNEFISPSTGEAAPKFTESRPTISLSNPMIRIVTAQELRTSFNYEADQQVDRSIAEISDFHFNDEFGCILETVGPSGEFYDHFDTRILNPGHAIEAAWFILREGQLRDRKDYIQLGCKILDSSWERGWDDEHGGLLYFVDVKGLPVQEYWHDMKFWWPQCEAMIATLLAFQLTGDSRYADWHRQVHNWSHQHFPDPEHGEWFGYLHRDGRLSSSLKGNLWKGPFHIPRMQLLCWQIVEQMLKDRLP